MQNLEMYYLFMNLYNTKSKTKKKNIKKLKKITK